jgi:2-amino-4-hydroxy-6-hydroxymethyldihydropteridine diphosphokinase
VLVPLAAIAPDLILPCNTAIDSLIDTKMLAELQQLGIDH